MKFFTKLFGSASKIPERYLGPTTVLTALEHVHKVVNIDQSPIGRNSRSNPATYIGFYDAIRELFAQTPLAAEREYKSGRFSFNVKGGRCEECQGEGVITTQLYFMPDVEVTCGACKGARFGPETLEVTLRGKTITDVLNMSIEEGVNFFAAEPTIGQENRGSCQSGPRISHARAVGDYSFRGRSAARQDCRRTLENPAIEAHALHPRRTDDRTSPGRCGAPSGVSEPPRGRGTHRSRHRTPSRRHQDRRLRDRSGTRRRPRRR